MVDAVDSKSAFGNKVLVRVQSSATLEYKMQKILQELLEQYNYFLFDFDGLLMNSEPLHFAAFKQAFANYNLHLADTFEEFVKMAHADASWLKTLENKNPHIQGRMHEVREHKQKLFLELIQKKEIELMPGAQTLLEALDTQQIKSCVVTNSKIEHIAIMKRPHKILNTIENWVCREDYEAAKPAPDGYLKALQFHPEKKAVGFEDTLKGIDALIAAKVKPVLVSSYLHTSHPSCIHLQRFV
jgi:beta-phosphoglucomutase